MSLRGAKKVGATELLGKTVNAWVEHNDDCDSKRAVKLRTKGSGWKNQESKARACLDMTPVSGDKSMRLRTAMTTSLLLGPDYQAVLKADLKSCPHSGYAVSMTADKRTALFCTQPLNVTKAASRSVNPWVPICVIPAVFAVGAALLDWKDTAASLGRATVWCALTSN